MIILDLENLTSSGDCNNNSPTEHINRQNRHSLGCDLDNTKIELPIWMSFLDSLGYGLDVGISKLVMWMFHNI